MNFIKSAVLFSIVLFCALGLATEQASAQTNKHWSWGMRGNVGLNTFKSDLPGKTPRRLAYQGGLVLNKSYTQKFSIQLEVLYSKEHYYNSGDTLESDPLNTGVGVVQTHQYYFVNSYDYTYIRAPLVMKYSILFTPRGVYPYYSKKERMGMDFYLGGFYGYNLKQKMTGNFRDENTVTIAADTLNPDSTYIVGPIDYLFLTGDTAAPDPDYKEIPIYKMDWGITFGIGFTYLIDKRTKFFIDVRYAIGMAPLDIHGHFSHHNKITGRSEKLFDVKSNSIQFGIGFIRRLGRDY